MSATTTEFAEQGSTAPQKPGIQSEARWRPTVRFVLSVVIAGALTGAAWLCVPNSLLGPTDIVGYPIYANFDIYRYTYGFYCIALLFPALAIAVILGISWKGPLRRLHPPSGGVMPLTNACERQAPRSLPPPTVTPRRYPPAPPGTAAPSVESVAKHSALPLPEMDRCFEELGTPAESPMESIRSTFWAAARVALPLMVLILECSIIQTDNRHIITVAGVLVGLLYVGLVTLGAAFLTSWPAGGRHSRRGRTPSTWRSGVARANSLLALTAVPLLWFVSQSTEVALGSGSHVVHYPWLPWWVAAVLTVVIFMAWRRGMAKARTLDARRNVESNVLTWIIGPLLIFLMTAVLPGALGTFSGFDDAQYLASPQLIFHHGLLPWRDIYLLHGILQDVLDTWIGLVTFGNSRWGGAAGLSMFTMPLGWMAVYAFAAYFCRRNRLFLVGITAIILGGLLLGVNPRFIPLPIILILFELVLRRRTSGWCWLFMLVVLAEVVVAPEAILFVPCLIGVLAVRELTDRDRVGWSRQSFPRTADCMVAGLALSLGWMAYLGLTGSLTSFFDYFLVFSSGHVLEGGVPTNWPVFHVSLLSLLWALPPLLWLLTVLRVTVKLRDRRSWTTTDWVMVAAAGMALIYFPKALDRADAGHVNEALSAAVPLLILWLIELLSLGDRAVRRLAVRTQGHLRLPVLPHAASGLSVLALLAASTLLPNSLSASLAKVPTDFHPFITEAADSTLPRLGYTTPGSVDTRQILDLESVLNRFAGANAPVFDYANEPGVLYYLLNRVPGTRYYYSAVSQTAAAQQQEISDLRTSRPPVVIFTDTAFGLPEYDGVLQSLRSFSVTSYLLANYHPVIDVRGQLVMLRNDLGRNGTTSGAGLTPDPLYFDSPTCNFGFIPNYSSLPNSTSKQNTIEIPLATPPTSKRDLVTVSGWGLTSPKGRPYSQFLLVNNGKVVHETDSHLSRPDVSHALSDSAAENSGFSVSATVDSTNPVQIYALASDGTARQFIPSPAIPHSIVVASSARSILSPQGKPITVVGPVSTGNIDSANRTLVQLQKLTVPGGVNLSSYQWLVLRGSFRTSSYVLADSANPDLSHAITFKILPSRIKTVYVRVGSCIQWHGYDALGGLYLMRSGPGDMPHPSIGLARSGAGAQGLIAQGARNAFGVDAPMRLQNLGFGRGAI